MKFRSFPRFHTAKIGEARGSPRRFRSFLIVSTRSRRAVGYAVAVLMVGFATVLRLGLDRILGEHHPFTLYFAAVAVASWYGGFGPGVLAIVLSYFGADWFFIAPRFEFNFPRTDVDEFMALLAFLFSGFAIAFTTKLLRQALHRARLKQQELEIENKERRCAEEALKLAQAQLQRHATILEEQVEERTSHLQDTIRSLEGVCYHLAHDLRAPLRAMEGYTGILARELAPALDAGTNRYLENISDAAERMDRLIAALLEYGRLGHSEFPLGPMSCGGAVFDILQELAPRMRATKASIAVPETFPEVMANEKLLELIFRQLLTNALTFVRPGVSPTIRIRFTREAAPQSAPRMRCWVEDNGIGIPAGREHKAFWIFERLHPGSTYPGIGMGLALASKAVERMQGKIGVETGEIEGSRFWFELPLARDETPWEKESTDVYDASGEIAEGTAKVSAH